ncbi:hypothetical protein EG329_008530 [Mollisiaceae sp. DMI_Dod_QoI]|nr:hypothetical protein EG329_008530 [Helotiales sp. DMI_Dod_QoI]
MASLSAQLQAVLNAATTKFHPLGRQYQDIIVTNVDALNSIGNTAEESFSNVQAASAIKAFSILFSDHVIIPTESSYEEEKRRNWSTTCWLPAACIVKLKNTIEVALALMIVRSMQCQFAVRSGGHNSNPGCSSIGESGILLDLSLLNEINLSEDKETAYVGPGATWDEVYEELEKYELTVVGGRASGVGVGGLITGGGMSHFSNHWGMACDNVVLADSTIVQTDIKENPDLFQALKGGGLNFGIVTRCDLKTYSDYRLWYTIKVYSPADINEVMKATVKVQIAMEEDDCVGFFLSINASFLVAGMLYRGQTQGTPPVFDVFNHIDPMSIALPETHGTQLSASQALSMIGKAKRETGTATVRVDSDLHVELHKKLQEIASDSKFTLVFTIQPIGKAAVEKGVTLGGNSMNISAEPQSWLGIVVEWTDDEDDVSARKKFRDLVNAIEGTAQSKGLLLDFKFMNDAGFIQSPLQSYGKEMVEFLKAQSKKWDPQDVFQKLQNGGHLLSKVRG